MEPIKAAELLIEKIKKDYANDVSLLVIMGSTIYNDTHDRSDLDLFFVPKTERGYHLGFTFIIDGIGFDFWALPWERLERIANHNERIVSVITEGQVLYCASVEDMERWNALKAKALDYSDRLRFITLSGEQLDKACVDLVLLMNAKTIADARYHAIVVIYRLGHALALLNCTSIKRGRKKLKGEILAMPLVPERFGELYDTAFYSSDKDEIICAFAGLIENTRRLIECERKKYAPQRSFLDNWSQLYEELINAYNKIAHACETSDPVTALFASVELTHEIHQVTKDTEVSPAVLPDLVGAYDPYHLQAFAAAAKQHQFALEKLLEEQGVCVKRFADFKELEKYLESL